MLPPTLFVCQNTACRRSGSQTVLAAFEAVLASDLASEVALAEGFVGAVVGCRCLGQCGNGPVVLSMPEQIWYYQVHPDEALGVLQRHLRKIDSNTACELE